MGVQGVRTSRIFLPGSLGLLKKYLEPKQLASRVRRDYMWTHTRNVQFRRGRCHLHYGH